MVQDILTRPTNRKSPCILSNGAILIDLKWPLSWPCSCLCPWRCSWTWPSLRTFDVVLELTLSLVLALSFTWVLALSLTCNVFDLIFGLRMFFTFTLSLHFSFVLSLLMSTVVTLLFKSRYNKKLSCRRETALRFLSLNILLSHSMSLKVIWNDTFESICVSPY